MPSRHSSAHSARDAAELARRTGAAPREVDIEPIVTAFQGRCAWTGSPLENLQARVRGMILMSLSNQHGHLVLATGNKSELAVGYSTLYGDAVGGFAPLKDVLKTQSGRWQVAQRRRGESRETPPIPEHSITKPPSAELAPGQLDTDSLPDYDLLDALLERYVERDLGSAALVAEGFDPALVERVLRLVDLAEYKRRQYPPGPKMTRAQLRPRPPPADDQRLARAPADRPVPSARDSCHDAVVTEPPPYAAFAAAATPASRVRIPHLRRKKEQGERWAMLTAYDQYAAEIFDAAGIPVLLVGDSAANNVLGYPTTIPVTVEELLPLVRAVAGAAASALVVADLPFGSYQESPQQALRTATRFLKEGGAAAVKLEGGAWMSPSVELLVRAGIPVMAHIGFTPQSEHALGGYRVQGRGAAGDHLVEDALALERAGAFAVVLEMVPGDVAGRVTRALGVPTIGIGAGPDCDAQVLVWQDMAGLRAGTPPRFVKRYADVRGTLDQAARDFAADVAAGSFPGPEHTFE